MRPKAAVRKKSEPTCTTASDILLGNWTRGATLLVSKDPTHPRDVLVLFANVISECLLDELSPSWEL